MALLFLGNSYTFFHDLNLVVEGLLDPTSDATTTRLADGGLAFPDHVARVSSHAEWSAALGADGPAWSWGVLQDQSQIPGFHGEDAVWEESAAAAVELDAMLQARGADTLFLLTWGRRDGDATNPGLYPDFPTMQDELLDGYVAYRDAVATAERPAWIAPAGLAWAAVYEATEDPADPTSLFWRLYDADGSHPSPAGTWLAACTIYTALTGESAAGQAPPAGVEAEEGAWLAEVAWTVVTSGAGGLTYPWQGGADTGGTDTGSTDTAVGETGDPGQEAEDSAGTDSGGPAAAPAGCGCGPGSPPAAAWALLLAGLARRRLSPGLPSPGR